MPKVRKRPRQSRYKHTVRNELDYVDCLILGTYHSVAPADPIKLLKNYLKSMTNRIKCGSFNKEAGIIVLRYAGTVLERLEKDAAMVAFSEIGKEIIDGDIENLGMHETED